MALQLARSAVERSPESVSSWLLLGDLLGAQGHPHEAVRVLEKAYDRFREHPRVTEALGRAMAKAGDARGALGRLRQGQPSPSMARTAFKILIRHGQLDEAASLEAQVAAHYPADTDLLELRAQRVRGEPRRLLDLCDGLLSIDPGNAHALYLKATALAQLGRNSEACELMDLQRLVWVVTIPATTDPGTMPNFLAKLTSEIVDNPTLHPDPAGHATRKGLRTGIFPAITDHATAELLAGLRREVELYCADLPEHPFVAARPDEMRLTAWALILRGTGRQCVHNHPASWLTGVYYVRSPAPAGRSGSLRIGVLPEWAGAPPWPVLEISPDPGKVVIFPSFVPHDTVPTGSAEDRISVAFDVADASD